MVKGMSLNYEDIKWAFEKMLELLEEWYPKFESDGCIEDCVKILELYIEE